MKHPCRFISSLLLMILGLAGCSTDENLRNDGPAAPEAAILNLYNWEGYILPELLAEFEQREGITVNLHTYQDEDDILAALQSGLPDADIVVVSDNIVQELHKARLLHSMDPDHIPNLQYSREHPFFFSIRGDELVTVPYLLGTVGILVNTSYVPEKMDSWNILWTPAYKGRIAMLDNSLDAFNAGCKVLEYSINTEIPDELAEIHNKLLEQRPLLAGYFDPVTLVDMMQSGELWAVQIYSGDAMAAIEQNPSLRYFVPREGSSIWIDCFVIPSRAEHLNAAERFINFMHDPEIMARNAAFLWYQPVNARAIPLLPEELRAAPEVFPPASVLERCEPIKPINAEAMRKRLSTWAELRAVN